MRDLPRYAKVTKWCEISGVGRTATYEMLAAGTLRAVKLNNSTLIDVWHGISYLETLPAPDVRMPAATRRIAAQAA